MQSYFEESRALLARIATTESEHMETAGRWLAETIASGGIWHVFGTGHSHAAAEEVYYRAGGLAPVQAILVPALMQHEGPVTSTRLERVPGLAAALLDRFDLRAGDLLTVVSNSGRNAVPVEFAEGARQRGLRTIALCSRAHADAAGPHPAIGRMLREVCDLSIDNGGQPGDAVLDLPGSALRVCATSTLANTAILQQVVYIACRALLDQGIEPPVFRSANLPGGDAWNAQLIERYGARCGLR